MVRTAVDRAGAGPEGGSPRGVAGPLEGPVEGVSVGSGAGGGNGTGDATDSRTLAVSGPPPAPPRAGVLVPGRVVSPVPGRVVSPVPGRVLSPVPGRVLSPVPGRVLSPVPGRVVADVLPRDPGTFCDADSASSAARSSSGAGTAARDASRFPTRTPIEKAAPRNSTAAKAMARTWRPSSDSSIFSRNRCSSRIPARLPPVPGTSENPENAYPPSGSGSPGGSSIRSGAATPRMPSSALRSVCASAHTRKSRAAVLRGSSEMTRSVFLYFV